MNKLLFWKRWVKRKSISIPVPEVKEDVKPAGVFSIDRKTNQIDWDLASKLAFPRKGFEIKQSPGAMDGCTDIPAMDYRFTQRGGMPDEVIGYFINQSFIGYQLCAVLAQNWLVNRACKIPAEDATRNGWTLSGIEQEDIDRLTELDTEWKLKLKVQEFERFTRVFGIRIALFCVESKDPRYYEEPFDINKVELDSYLGISQIDPTWCAPEFDFEDLSNPASVNFYVPTYWVINGKRYHRSHLSIAFYSELPDLLKPTYNYGGMPLPQLIWTRVYAAERSADEGPQLLMTKRMNVINTDLDAAMQDMEAFRIKQQEAAESRDNYGFMNLGKDDNYSQHETSLGDVDSVIMTEYQLVASVAEMPATKLLGTSPKGFNPTGEFEMGSYRETLASIQEHHLTPLLERHYEIAMRSLGIDGEVDFVWNPLDEPTEEQVADTQLKRAQKDQILVDTGIISQQEARNRLEEDRQSGYEFEVDEEGEESRIEAALNAALSREGLPKDSREDDSVVSKESKEE